MIATEHAVVADLNTRARTYLVARRDIARRGRADTSLDDAREITLAAAGPRDLALPRWYVGEHVDHACAITADKAQGTPSTTYCSPPPRHHH